MAAVEFAFIAPVLVALLVGATELGLAIHTQNLVQEAAAAGAQSALKGYNATTITTAVQSASPTMTIQASPAPSEFYACPASTGLTHVTQGSNCADGQPARHYADVWANATRPTVFGTAYGLPASLSAHATMRVP